MDAVLVESLAIEVAVKARFNNVSVKAVSYLARPKT